MTAKRMTREAQNDSEAQNRLAANVNN